VPSPGDDAISWYDAHAAVLASQYEALSAEQVHAWLQDFLPDKTALIFDVGAGTGRDAAWFAAKGHEVVAVEPASEMRRNGQNLHPNHRIRWVDDRLPALVRTLRLGLAADVILLSAVWQHLTPADRPRAFRKLVTLLKSGGLLAISLRHGPAEPERCMHEVSLEEIERLARAHGLVLVHTGNTPDRMGRPGVSWTQVALRLPDDGTGALPLLRHVILNDQKSATYKLGLLRVLCRAADSAAGLAQDEGGDYVTVPLGLVALNWLRLYLPLIRADLPQTPTNLQTNGQQAALVALINAWPLRSPSPALSAASKAPWISPLSNVIGSARSMTAVTAFYSMCASILCCTGQ
jgi:SAM-dependent methyltransferase